MSDAELHFIRARLQGGILSKARRGELPMPLPVGLVTDPAGKVVLNPDKAVQDAIRHPFQTFRRTGSARAVVYAFQRDGLLFPSRIRKGQRKGELAWNELTHWRVLRTLHNLRHASAFVYGQRRTRKTPDGRTTTRQLPRDQLDHADPRCACGLSVLGAVRSQPEAARRQRVCARDRPDRRPGPRRTRAAAGPGDLRTVRRTDDRPIPLPPRHARPGLSLRSREHPAGPPDLSRPSRSHDRPGNQQAAARHRHTTRARGRTHRPNRAQQLREIYRASTEDALVLLEAWLQWARRARLEPVRKLARRITEQRARVEAALTNNLSNARVEQINTQIRLMVRRGFGCHTEDAVIALAMLSLVGLCPPLPGR